MRVSEFHRDPQPIRAATRPNIKPQPNLVRSERTKASQTGGVHIEAYQLFVGEFETFTRPYRTLTLLLQNEASGSSVPNIRVPTMSLECEPKQIWLEYRGGRAPTRSLHTVGEEQFREAQIATRKSLTFSYLTVD
ncbi:hypothetical protein CS8_011670 [Cupriavidus sp. 8B]